jgi:putative phosphoesterase
VKIGVISDTHIRTDEELEAFKEIFFKHLSDIDLLLHAGDIVSLNVFKWLNKQVKIVAVSGNMDFPGVTGFLPKSKIVKVDKFKIGLTHGWGPPSGLIERVKRIFKQLNGGSEVECIVFGHTHSAFNEVIDEVLFFNPGTPTDKKFSSYNSVGFLEIGVEIKGKIEKI